MKELFLIKNYYYSKNNNMKNKKNLLYYQLTIFKNKYNH